MFHQGTQLLGLSAHKVSPDDEATRLYSVRKNSAFVHLRGRAQLHTLPTNSVFGDGGGRARLQPCHEPRTLIAASAADVHRISAPQVAALILGLTLLAAPSQMSAQRGGGGGGGRGGISLGGAGGSIGTRPDGVSDKDDLKDFHRAMEIQATPEQRAAFAKVAQYTQVASDQLQAFRDSLQKSPAPSPLSDRGAAIAEAIANARAGNQNFFTSFSAKQKDYLQDTLKKVEKADGELDRQTKALDQIIPSANPEQVSTYAASLDKALTSFQNEQIALGREMSILFPPAGEVATFTLPAVTNSINFAGQSISMPAVGAVSRKHAQDGLFTLQLVTDLTDLQQNVGALLRAAINRSPGCGEQIEILDATLTPVEPFTLLVAKVHFERWVCPHGAGRGGAMEVASGDADIEIKLTPTIDPASGLTLTPETTRVQAEGFLRNSLRTGDLGTTLRDQVAAAILVALVKGSDLKTILPPVAQQSATLQQVEFQNAGADQMNLILNGQLQFTDEQTQQFAAQLKQRLSAQAGSK